MTQSLRQPLVTCIMPTLPNRSVMATVSSKEGLRQTFTSTEWTSLNDVTCPIGSVRNRLIRRSTGDIVAHFDDDDWSAPNRLERCVYELKHGADLVGSSRIYYRDWNGNAWLYDGASVTFGPPWIAGGTFVYRRSLWDKIGGFDPWAEQGEDTDFVKRARAVGARIVDLADPTLYVALVHPGNTCRKQTSGDGWVIVPLETVTTLMEGGAHCA